MENVWLLALYYSRHRCWLLLLLPCARAKWMIPSAWIWLGARAMWLSLCRRERTFSLSKKRKEKEKGHFHVSSLPVIQFVQRPPLHQLQLGLLSELKTSFLFDPPLQILPSIGDGSVQLYQKTDDEESRSVSIRLETFFGWGQGFLSQGGTEKREQWQEKKKKIKGSRRIMWLWYRCLSRTSTATYPAAYTTPTLSLSTLVTQIKVCI